MTAHQTYHVPQPSVEVLILDMSDCYTWSFPEFLPFCRDLYYFSSFKKFKTLARAW